MDIKKRRVMKWHPVFYGLNKEYNLHGRS